MSSSIRRNSNGRSRIRCHLQKEGIISPIEYSDWAAPIVVAKKSNGNIRICGDYSRLNQTLEPHQYPLPTPDEIFAKLAKLRKPNKKIYSIIDLSDAFLQIIKLLWPAMLQMQVLVHAVYTNFPWN